LTRRQTFIVAAQKELLVLASLFERSRKDVLFESAVGVSLEELVTQSLSTFRTAAFKGLERAPPCAEVDRPPIVRINEALVPEFRALIRVGDARDRDTEQRLREPVGRPIRINFRTEHRSAVRR